MGLSSAVQWWEQDQLRVLVLASLAVQYFLFFFAGRRKSRIPAWYRFFIWILYLASDALAIYALATLFNRQKKLQYRSRDLQVLWAPILLIHLGGQLVITAYNIEDNELWKRHIITSSSQVTVGIYVFYKSWPSSADKKLLNAEIILFALGAAKCFQKPLALMKASFNSLDNFFDVYYATKAADGKEDIEAYVQNAKAAMLLKDQNYVDYRTYTYHTLLLDFAWPFETRLSVLKMFCHMDDGRVYEKLVLGLSQLFNILYTRDQSAGSSIVMWVVSMVLSLVTIILFHHSHKQAYSRSDVIITYVLLYGTLLLECCSIVGLALLSEKCSATVAAQLNLIGFFVQTKKPSKLMLFARSLSCEVLVSQFFGMDSCHSCEDITKLAHQHIKDGWEMYITDAQSYKEFNDIRGQWTLHQMGFDEQLGWSLEMPFDRSVLIWHLATDFCFYCRSTSQEHVVRAQLCREISNYMTHLLFANPEMLLPGSRKHIFKAAYLELKHIFKVQETPMDKGKLAQKVVDTWMLRDDPQTFSVDDAVHLYSRLIDIDETKMWEVIQGVWIEMLCFSAGRCRGYLHAKSFGVGGGEYLSCIWLLLHHTGMETFQHRFERTQNFGFSREKKEFVASMKKKHNLENEGEDATAPSTYQGFNASTEGGTCQGMNVPHKEEILLDHELPDIV